MKLTKTQLKQIIKEALTDEDLAQVMDLLNPVLSGLEDNRKVVDQNVKVLQAKVDKLKMSDLHKLHQRFKELNGDVQSLEDNLMTINDKLSITKPSRFAEPDVVRGPAKSTTDTDAGGFRTNEDLKKKELNEGLKEVVLAFLMGTAAMLPTTDEAWAKTTKENPVFVYDQILSNPKLSQEKRKEAENSFLKFKKQTKVSNWKNKAENLWSQYKNSPVRIDIKSGKPWVKLGTAFKRDTDHG
tara:strand:+ start:410 stop:1132 length:723 start_codon:yes stop_codon:yes gene_type:complete